MSQLRQLPKAYATTINTALTVVTGFLWAEAIKSLFAPNGALEVAAQYGPWVTAAVVTFATVYIGSFLSQRGLVQETAAPLKKA